MNTFKDTVLQQLSYVRQEYGISAAVLKWTAIITMLIDHTGAVLLRRLKTVESISRSPALLSLVSQLYILSRRIGRIAFPLFCFMIVEGYFHTRNLKKYLLRLFLFALMSEFPFDYALHQGQPLMYKQNVYFTLLIGLLVIWAVHDVFRGFLSIQLIVMITGMFFAKFLRTDYQYHGVFLIELIYIMRHSRIWQSLCGGAYLYQYEGFPTPLSFLLTFLYNGKRGRQPKYFFYFFYPLHLLFLGVLTYVILPQWIA